MIKFIRKLFVVEKTEFTEKEKKVILQSLRYVLHRITAHPDSGAARTIIRKDVEKLINILK